MAIFLHKRRSPLIQGVNFLDHISRTPMTDSSNREEPPHNQMRWRAISFNLYCIVAAFSTYFCMYAFRKPISAGTYAGLAFGPLTFKSALILSQVAGYTLSKFIGIRFISELAPQRRIPNLVILIGAAHFALLMLAIVPPPYNIICMFFNGLPLGLIWGIVFSFLEGRRYTELLGAGLSVSFILASGIVKGVGKALIDFWKVPELWMPFTTGLVFVVPLGIAIWLLHRIPPPNQADIDHRSVRVPMTSSDRQKFIHKFSWGLIALIVFHMILTAYRDFRDNFAVEILSESNAGENVAEMLSISELPTAFLVLLVLGFMFLIRNHQVAIITTHALMFGGALLSGITTLLFTRGHLSPFLWFMLTGFGLYFAYVPFHSMLFDRLVAAARLRGNAGYLIYLADSTGYLASVAVLLYKDFGSRDLPYFRFFAVASYMMSAIGGVLIIFAGWYLFHRLRFIREAQSAE